MNKTSIEWVKNPDGSQGYTWNPITGCLNGCSYCYARKLANGRLRRRYLDNPNVSPSELGTFPHLDPFYPRFWPERLKESGLYADKPRGIFVCDMGELFGDWIPTDWQAQIFFEMRTSPQHRFYLLTKQPQNLHKFSPFPENCWVGVTATNQDMLDLAVGHLRNIVAKVRFISLEPFLESMREPSCDYLPGFNFSCLHWIILGAQTKPYLCPQSNWVGEIVSAADHAGTSVFLKDNLYMIKPKRQEMPK